MRYVVKIDEEGFPMFDGLRCSDPELLNILLGNIRRFKKDDPRSPLITTCEGEDAWIEAFDCPLVGQQVQELTEQNSTWIFPGGLTYQISHQELSMDAWHRIHTYIGPDCIPAVLSRKAQNEFYRIAPLNHIQQQLQKPHRHTSQAQDSSFWQDIYTQHQDGWELGKCNPVLPAESTFLRSQLSTQAQLAVPAAGRAHEAEWLAQQGYEVNAFDFAPQALHDFKSLYPHSSVHYECADLFEYFAHKTHTYEGVFELASFVAIDPTLRRRYLELIHQSLRHQGFYFGIFFLFDRPTRRYPGPPHGLTQWELRELSKDLFNIRQWHVSEYSVEARKRNELWTVLQKK